MRRRLLGAVAAAVALGGAACSNDTGPTSGSTPTDEPAATSTTRATVVAAATTATTPVLTPATRPPPAAVPEGRWTDVVFGDVERTDDVAYATSDGPDGRPVELLLDVVEPANDPADERPAVVLVHGGGFVNGDRHGMDALADDLAERGWVAVPVEYRLADRDVGNGWQGSPAVRQAAADAQHDVQAAVRFLRANAGRWRIDPTRIAVAGYSAGGMTAIEVASGAIDPGTSGTPDQPSDVGAAVAISGAAVELDELSAHTAPLLLLHGRDDTVVPLELAQRTCDVANQVGSSCTLVVTDDVGHDLPFRHRDDVATATAEFLTSELGLLT